MGDHQNIINELIRRGMETLDNPRERVSFTTDNEADEISRIIAQIIINARKS
jgi:hypothetical protein